MKTDREIVGTLLGFDDFVSIFSFGLLFEVEFHGKYLAIQQSV